MSSSYPQIARCSACHMYLVCARYLIGIQYHFIVRIIFFSLCIQALWISWSRISCQDKEQGNVSFGRIIMNFDSYSLIFSSSFSSFYYTFVFRVMSKEWLFFSYRIFWYLRHDKDWRWIESHRFSLGRVRSEVFKCTKFPKFSLSRAYVHYITCDGFCTLFI